MRECKRAKEEKTFGDRVEFITAEELCKLCLSLTVS